MSKLQAFAGGRKFEAELDGERVSLDGNNSQRIGRTPTGLIELFFGNQVYTVYCNKITDNSYEIWIKSFVFTVTLEDQRGQLLAKLSNSLPSHRQSLIVHAPMPGLVAQLLVSEGTTVHPGSPLIILEAMKMENEIKATADGVVSKIHVSNSSRVEKGQSLMTLEPLK